MSDPTKYESQNRPPRSLSLRFNRLTRDEFAALCDKMTFKLIADEYGVAPWTVSGRARDLGIIPKFQRGPLLSAEDKEKLVTWHEAGMSFGEIGKKLNRHETTISQAYNRIKSPRPKCYFDQSPFPRPTTNHWSAYADQRYDEIDKQTLYKEWPYGPLNGKRFLKSTSDMHSMTSCAAALCTEN